MSKRSVLSIGAVVLLPALTWLAREQGGIDVTPAAGETVAIAGDTIPTGGVPAAVVALMEQGRAWRAARAMRAVLERANNPNPESVLFAAIAEAEWAGWTGARDYLEEKPWLDDIAGGAGWYWLGRAREATDDGDGAIEAYDRFLDLAAGGADAGQLTTAELRRGLLLLREGRREEGTDALLGVRERAPYLADWMNLLAAEAVAESGDTAAVRELVGDLPDTAGRRHRGRVALVRAYELAEDLSGARRQALAFQDAGGTAAQRAQFSLLAGRFALREGDNAAAREAFGAAMELAPASAAAREAAGLMSDLSGLTPAERLSIAEVYERHGNRPRAIEGFRAWLAAGAGSAGTRNDVRLRLGRALFNSGDLSEAQTTLAPLLNAPGEMGRAALLLTGRAHYQRGNIQQAARTFDQLAERFPGSAEGSEGLHLLADRLHDRGEHEAAIREYRRVADAFPGTDRAGLSLMRLAGIHSLAGDHAEAASVWEGYRTRYPRGERWLEATYWAGRSYESLGNDERARQRFEEVRQRDPLSYYALLSADRLGVDYWPVPMGPSPAVDPAAEARVAEWMQSVDRLREAGLYTEADLEAQRLADAAGSDDSVLYPLAEALNERGYALRGIRIGQQLQQRANGLNARLLRILYPFPYRPVIEAEAEEQGLDPFVVAALTRQESLFTARISSPVGARGLMQIMPATGRTLAANLDVGNWDPELLFQPEVNVYLGTHYLADQMRRYDASLPAVFSAYNAGPHRIDAWMGYPEWRDEELFTERIPFRETRDYVKILRRNIAVYRGLYGDAP